MQYLCASKVQHQKGRAEPQIDVQVIPDSKGKGKNKGKSKNSGKSKPQKDGRYQSAYFGCPHEGSVIQVKLEGVQVDQLADLRIGGWYGITNLKPRAGQDGIVLWTERTTIVLNSADTHPVPPSDFPYQVENPYQCATMTHFSECKINAPIHMVLKITSAEEKTTTTNESFLWVYGNDMWTERAGPLRMWRFTDQDVKLGMICIIRGLKVAEERVQDPFTGAWYVDPKGGLKLECTPATAVEDVSEHVAISQLYQ